MTLTIMEAEMVLMMIVMKMKMEMVLMMIVMKMKMVLMMIVMKMKMEMVLMITAARPHQKSRHLSRHCEQLITTCVPLSFAPVDVVIMTGAKEEVR